jgi:hypothetical protein
MCSTSSPVASAAGCRARRTHKQLPTIGRPSGQVPSAVTCRGADRRRAVVTDILGRDRASGRVGVRTDDLLGRQPSSSRFTWPRALPPARRAGPDLRRSFWGRSSTSRATACRTRTSARAASRSQAAWEGSLSSPRGEARSIRRRSELRRAPPPISSTSSRFCARVAGSSFMTVSAGTARGGSRRTCSCGWRWELSPRSSPHVVKRHEA